jgi:hypothetical protein
MQTLVFSVHTSNNSVVEHVDRLTKFGGESLLHLVSKTDGRKIVPLRVSYSPQENKFQLYREEFRFSKLGTVSSRVHAITLNVKYAVERTGVVVQWNFLGLRVSSPD